MQPMVLLKMRKKKKLRGKVREMKEIPKDILTVEMENYMKRDIV